MDDHTKKLGLAPGDCRELLLSGIEQMASAASFETLRALCGQSVPISYPFRCNCLTLGSCALSLSFRLCEVERVFPGILARTGVYEACKAT